MRLEGKVAIITGAGRGIGKAIALAFAGEGAQLEATAREVQALGRGDSSAFSGATTIAVSGGSRERA